MRRSLRPRPGRRGGSRARRRGRSVRGDSGVDCRGRGPGAVRDPCHASRARVRLRSDLGACRDLLSSHPRGHRAELADARGPHGARVPGFVVSLADRARLEPGDPRRDVPGRGDRSLRHVDGDTRCPRQSGGRGTLGHARHHRHRRGRIRRRSAGRRASRSSCRGGCEPSGLRRLPMAILDDPRTFGRTRLSFADEAEIDDFVATLARFERAEIGPDQWRAYRLVRGTYGQRQADDAQMLRIKIPQGVLDWTQLRAVADVSERYSRGFAHITTRQNFQLHFMRLSDVELAMRQLASAGLTTREACGNSVRNITACPYAGVAADEAFDVTPYAEALTRYLLRHPLSS